MVVPPLVSLDSKKKGSQGDGIPDGIQSTTSSISSSSVVWVGTLPHFLNQWRSITSNILCLIWLKATISSFGSGLCWSVIPHGLALKDAAVHCSVIQEEVQEL